MSIQDEIYMVADEMRGIANEGARYADNDYDRQRYGRALSLSARLVSSIEKRPEDEVMEEYKQNLARVTPAVGAEAAVLRDGTMLLIKREDNGLWAMPGGATEVGETWAQSAERELREETGVVGTAKKLLGVFDSRIWGSRSKYHFYAGVWLVEASDVRLTSASSRSTTCRPRCRRDTSDVCQWRSNLRTETCRRRISTRRPDTRLKGTAGYHSRS